MPWYPFCLHAGHLPGLSPFPSAMASAKLPNKTVNQRMTDGQYITRRSVPDTSQRKQEHHKGQNGGYKTINMTGFFIWVLGFSLIKESLRAPAHNLMIGKYTLFLFIHVSLTSLCYHLEKLSHRAK